MLVNLIVSAGDASCPDPLYLNTWSYYILLVILKVQNTTQMSSYVECESWIPYVWNKVQIAQVSLLQSILNPLKSSCNYV
jgi:hypothetical protein